MIGRYCLDISCDSCSYNQRLISRPSQFKPIDGIYKSIIEDRWCHSCNKIQKVFTGIGGGYDHYDIDYLKGFYPQNREELIEKLDKLSSELKSIQKRRGWFTRSKIDRLRIEILEHEHRLVQTSLIDKCVDDLNQRSIDFYNSFKPSPRCLECQSDQVSDYPYEKDLHTCGGSFITVNPHRFLFGAPLSKTVSKYHLYTYDQYGYCTKSLHDIPY